MIRFATKMPVFNVFVIICALCNGITAKVLLISMDGFRWDYINNIDTPNFDMFARKGTRAPYINNPFLTKTFPSHYTIATGLYEESHGIVENDMYDPIFNESFNMGNTETKWWDGGEPIWITARKHELKSAVFFWPGSETKISGMRANIWNKYDDSIKFEYRIDQVIQWLSNDTFFDIELAMLYFEEPDRTGHLFGPNSEEVKAMVREMDGYIGDIVQKFEDYKLWDKVNVIVTSDHGMAEVDQNKRLIDLSKYIDLDLVDRAPTQGPTVNILPKTGQEDNLYHSLLNISHLTVYRKPNFPQRWHYQDNRRILPILALAEEGWLIALNQSNYSYTKKGTHGFDNNLMSMKPIFYARGPNIKQNFEADPFNSVDIYPLVCKLLGITPAPNNGTLEHTKQFLVGLVDISSTASTVYTSLTFLWLACGLHIVL